jgi:hypothetical protein
MSVLSLFPARIRFVNQDGTLTQEALRMLEVLVERSGGMLGDVGADVFASQVVQPAAPVDAMLAQQMPVDAPQPDLVMQPVPRDNVPGDIVQQPLDYSPGTGISLSGNQFALKDTAVAPGTYGNATNIAQFTVDQQGRITNAQNVPTGGVNFSGSFTGKTVTVANGIITSVV